MKRSEAVENIVNVLMNNHPAGMDEFSDIAESILSAVESMGMQPPGHTYWNRGKNGGIMPSAKNGEQIHTWENE